MKEARPKRPSILLFHLLEILRKGKSREVESRFNRVGMRLGNVSVNIKCK